MIHVGRTAFESAVPQQHPWGRGPCWVRCARAWWDTDTQQERVHALGNVPVPLGSRTGKGKTEGEIPHQCPAAPWWEQPPNPRLLLPTLLWAGRDPRAHLWLALSRAECLLPFPPTASSSSSSWSPGTERDGDRAGTASCLTDWSAPSSFFSKIALSPKCWRANRSPRASLLALRLPEVPGWCARNTPHPQRWSTPGCCSLCPIPQFSVRFPQDKWPVLQPQHVPLWWGLVAALLLCSFKTWHLRNGQKPATLFFFLAWDNK